MGTHFIVVTDHNSLKYLQTQTTLSRCQARWSEFLAEFGFEIVYKPRKGHVVADALSRLQVVDCGTTSKGFSRENLFTRLEEAYKVEKETKRILEGLVDQKDFTVIHNKIFYTRNGRRQLYVPSGPYRDLIMSECHDTRHAGHLGVKKTLELIQRDFYWPTIQADVTAYVQMCEECQRNKPSN